MSDNIETIPAPAVAAPTPDELAARRKVREDAINKRVAELQGFVGKWFLPNDAEGIRADMPILVSKYVGIHVLKGIATYIYSVEIPSHAAWMVSATDFLEAHHIIDAPKTAATATDLPR